MQVMILLLLFFSDVFAFGWQPLYGYPTWVAVVWTVCSAMFLFIPYFRTPCYDESSVSS